MPAGETASAGPRGQRDGEFWDPEAVSVAGAERARGRVLGV